MTAATPQPTFGLDAAAQPAPVVKPEAVAPPAPPVRLAELAEAAQAAIRVTAREGGASATIVLHPQELGTVEIHLHYGTDGVTATVRADSPQAAQALQQASPDLRRSLEAQGMTLLGLDVRDRSSEAGDQAPTDRRRRGRPGSSLGTGADETEAVSLDPRRLPLAGSQIDVLA